MAEEQTTNPRIEELKGRLGADPKSRLFYPLAEEFRKIKQYAEAERILRAGLENHAGYLSAWISLGRVLKELGRHPEAVDVLEKALTIDPENVVAARLAAENYEALGERVEAIKKYKLVRALHPADDEVEEVIGRLEKEIYPDDLAETERIPLPRTDTENVTMPLEAVREIPEPLPADEETSDEGSDGGGAVESSATMPFAMMQAEPETADEHEEPFARSEDPAEDLVDTPESSEGTLAAAERDVATTPEVAWDEAPLGHTPTPNSMEGAEVEEDFGDDGGFEPPEAPAVEEWAAPGPEEKEPEAEVPWSTRSPEVEEAGEGLASDEGSWPTNEPESAAVGGPNRNRRKIARLQSWLDKVSVRVTRV